jgi:hypothetical protein
MCVCRQRYSPFSFLSVLKKGKNQPRVVIVYVKKCPTYIRARKRKHNVIADHFFEYIFFFEKEKKSLISLLIHMRIKMSSKYQKQYKKD